MWGRHRNYAGQERTAAVLDAGSQKICCMVAQLPPSHKFKTNGCGAPVKVTASASASRISLGAAAGKISGMDAAEGAIRSAIAAAERAAGVTVDAVFAAASCGPFSSESFSASVPITDGPVDDRDIGRIMQAARHSRPRWAFLFIWPGIGKHSIPALIEPPASAAAMPPG